MKKILVILIAALTLGAGSTSAQFIRNIKTPTNEPFLKYQGDVEVQFITDFDNRTNIGVATTHGLKVSPYFFAGLGVKVMFGTGSPDAAKSTGGDSNSVFLTPFLSLKGYLPLNSDWRLFINPTIGYALGLKGQYSYYGPNDVGYWSYNWFDYKNYFDWSATVGAEFKMIYLGVGVGTASKWDVEQPWKKPYAAQLMLKLGVKF